MKHESDSVQDGVRSSTAPAEALVGSTYRDQAGVAYFEYQRRIGEKAGHIDARKFQPHIAPEATVLDFGCGGGYLVRALKSGRQIGVEPNQSARAVCIAAGTECFERIEHVNPGEVDVVISNHVLEHVASPVGTLASLRRVLRPNGRLVLCVPIDDWRTQKTYRQTDPDHHLHTWTPQLLGNSMSEAGFVVRPGDISILAEAWPPGIGYLTRALPEWALTISMKAWSSLRNRRQIVAIGRLPDR